MGSGREELAAATARYAEALRSTAERRVWASNVRYARTEVLTSIHRAWRRGGDEDPARLLEGVVGALADVEDERPDDRRLVFEAGAWDGVSAFVQLDPVSALAADARELARNAQLVRILRALHETDQRLSHQELVVRAHPHPAQVTPGSAATMMTRWINQLERAGLVYSVRAGKEERVGLLADGVALLDLFDRGALPDPTAEDRVDFELLGPRSVAALVERPDTVTIDPADVTWVGAWAGAVQWLARTPGTQGRWRPSEQLFARCAAELPRLGADEEGRTSLKEWVSRRLPADGGVFQVVTLSLVDPAEGVTGETSTRLLHLDDALDDDAPEVSVWAPAATRAASGVPDRRLAHDLATAVLRRCQGRGDALSLYLCASAAEVLGRTHGAVEFLDRVGGAALIDGPPPPPFQVAVHEAHTAVRKAAALRLERGVGSSRTSVGQTVLPSSVLPPARWRVEKPLPVASAARERALSVPDIQRKVVAVTAEREKRRGRKKTPSAVVTPAASLRERD